MTTAPRAAESARTTNLLAWAACVVVNLVVGYLGVVPFLELITYLLMETGAVEPTPKFATDGQLGLAIAAVFATLVLLLFAMLNLGAGLLSGVGTRGRFWGVATLVLVLPSAVVHGWPDVWNVIGWDPALVELIFST